eukprot:2858809-Pyramimonas_sp.AAC.1
MTNARALRMSIVLVGPPGYFWKQGPMPYTIVDLGLQVMRVRCCKFGLKLGRPSKLPSGSCLQVATTYARIPTNSWGCACLQGGPRDVLSVNWIGMARAPKKQNGAT